MKIRAVNLYSNGIVAVFGANNKPIPELQGPFLVAREKIKPYIDDETEYFIAIWGVRAFKIPREHFFCETWGER